VFYSSIIFSQNLSAEKIYKKVADAVVVINGYDSKNKLLSQGSGVILNDKGFVVTNYHILANCERFEILHDKKNVNYDDIIGIDVVKDILILKIINKKFSSIKIGNSKTLDIGQKIYAIGNPLGFQNTISEGIISGFRTFEESGQNFIQITASISPGSSGGAVVNDKGELIGISALSAKEGQNINFAIPIDEILGIKLSSYLKDKSFKDFEWFVKGREAYEKGYYQNSIKYYTNFIEAYPFYDAAYNNRGLAKKNSKDFSGAIQDFNKAIQINPNSINAYYNLGNAHLLLKDFSGAIQDFDKAIEINPKFEIAYYNRGLAKSIDDNRSAIQDFNKAIEIDPNYADAYFGRGLSKYLLEDKIGACLDWSKAGELGLDKAYDVIRKYCN
jgi:tetratricopeptide (TPR) repeat protein